MCPSPAGCWGLLLIATLAGPARGPARGSSCHGSSARNADGGSPTRDLALPVASRHASPGRHNRHLAGSQGHSPGPLGFRNAGNWPTRPLKTLVTPSSSACVDYATPATWEQRMLAEAASSPCLATTQLCRASGPCWGHLRVSWPDTTPHL